MIRKILLLTILLLFLASPVYSATWCEHDDIETGVLCEEASGDLQDCSSNNEDGADYGSPLYQQTGKFGDYAVGSNGNDYFDFGAETQWDSDPFSIVIWYKPDGNSDDWCRLASVSYYSSATPWQLIKHSTERFYGEVQNTVPDSFNTYDASVDTTCTTGTWCHFAMAVDMSGGIFKFYKNGVEMKDQTSVTGDLRSNGGWINHRLFREEQATQNCDGDIDEYAYFSGTSVLTSTDINAIMDNGLEAEMTVATRRIW